MGTAQRGTAFRDLATLFQAGTAVGLTDAELLERFATRSGDAAELAFTTLVERHGPMVHRVCRRVLGDAHDVDDAFQATFLVLVRRARAIRRRDSVGSWLYGVAFRVASSARAAALRRSRHERKGAEMMPRASAAHLPEDIGSAVQAELARLPEKYRAPVVLCYLEGQSYEAAAQQLRWPIGTVKSRLARARERLRSRLVRRGLAPSALAVGVALEAEACASRLAPALLDSTVRAAIGFAAGPSAASGAVAVSVVNLAEGVLKAMFIAKVKSITLTLCCAGLFATGAVAWGQAAGRFNGPPDEPDRLKEVERKLDRVLRALEGTREDRPEGEDAYRPARRGVDKRSESRATDRPAAEGRQSPFSADRVPVAEDRRTPSPPPAVSMRPPDRRSTDSLEVDRLTVVERRLDALQRRLDQLEARFERRSGTLQPPQPPTELAPVPAPARP